MLKMPNKTVLIIYVEEDQSVVCSLIAHPAKSGVLEKLTVTQIVNNISTLWNPKIQYDTKKSLPPVPLLSQLNPPSKIRYYFF
jgi:hypothetical protein